MARRTQRFRVAVLWLLVAGALTADVTVGAPLVGSTFDSNADGWTLVSTLGYSGPVTWTSPGGNPGGFIYGQDPDTGAFGFKAPHKFTDIKSAAYGQMLTFDIAAYQQPDGPTSWMGLSGGGYTFVCGYAAPATPNTWYSRGVLLHESAGWVNPNNGLPATHQQMVDMLAGFDGLVIAAEFVQGLSTDISGLDNVMITPEPATLVLLTLGGLAVMRRRR